MPAYYVTERFRLSLQRVFAVLFTLFVPFIAFPQTTPDLGVEAKFFTEFNKGEYFYNYHEPDTAIRYYTNALKLAQKDNMAGNKIMAMIAMANIYSDKEDYETAKEFLDDASALLSLSEGLYPDIKIKYLLARAKILCNTKFYKESKIFCGQARELMSNNFSDSVCVELELYTGLNEFYLGNEETAVSNFNKLLSLDDNYVSVYAGEILYSLFFKVMYLNYSNTAGSGKCISDAERIITHNKDSSCHSIGYLYRTYGLILISMGKYKEALNYLLKSKREYKKQGNRYLCEINNIIYNQGYCYFFNKDYVKAKMYFDELLRLNSAARFLTPAQMYELKLFFALSLQRINDNERALGIFNEVLKNKVFLTTHHFVNLLDYLGSVHKSLKDYSNAELYYSEAVEKRKELIPDDLLNMARSYHNLGDLYIDMGDFGKAEEFLTKSSDILSRIKEKGTTAGLLYTTFARLKTSQNMLDTTAGYYQMAINEFCSGKMNFEKKNHPGKVSITSAVDLLNAIKGKARTYFMMAENERNIENRKKLLLLSLKCYKAASWVTDTVRSGFQFNESRLFLAGNEKKMFLNAVETAYELYSITSDKNYIKQAFEFAERSKSNIMVTNLQEYKTIQKGSIPIKKYNKLKNIRAAISSYENILNNNSIRSRFAQKKIAAISNGLFSLYDELEELDSDIKKKYPGFFAKSYSPEIAGIDDVAGKLLHNQVLLEYSLSQDKLFTYVVTQGKYEMFSEIIYPEFHADMNSVYKSLTGFNLHSSDYTNYMYFVVSSARLYNLLIAPYRKWTGLQRLIIIPDGILCFLPFETLLQYVPDTKYADYSKLPYMVKTNAVSYSNSATLLFIDKGIKTASRGLLAVAPVYNTLPACSNHLIPDSSVFSPIAGAKEESENILKVIDGLLLEGETATETEFRKICSGFQILHFAMHSMADSVNYFNPFLFFGNCDSTNDGLFYGWEIPESGINASLVVLSACGTGTGKFNRGEGVLHIARSFLSAGCPAVIMTLWDVDDLSSIGLITMFYKFLFKKDEIDIALQKAKIKYLASADPLNSHPYYWAAYIVTGNTDVIKLRPSKSKYIYYAATLLFVLFSAMIIRIEYKRKKKV